MTTQTTQKSKGLLKAHETLLADLAQLVKVCQAPTADIGSVAAALRKTQEHIAQHFRFEEQDGYMDAVLKRQPYQEHVVKQLQEEHKNLLDGLTGLIREAQLAQTPVAALTPKVHSWVNSVRTHEARENQLVQDAYNLDITAED